MPKKNAQNWMKEEHLKNLIKKDHPMMSEDEIEELFDRIDKIADILFDDWVKLRKIRLHSSKKSIEKIPQKNILEKQH
jgi:hypothetical protein